MVKCDCCGTETTGNDFGEQVLCGDCFALACAIVRWLNARGPVQRDTKWVCEKVIEVVAESGAA